MYYKKLRVEPRKNIGELKMFRSWKMKKIRHIDKYHLTKNLM